MSELVVHFAPGSCSRVTLIALVETGASFETVLMKFGKGANRTPEYRRLNPNGKVPVLVIDGAPLTENVAILTYLNTAFPAAALLPPAATPLDAARQLADLCFCSATLHPLVTRLRMPGKIGGPEAAVQVRDVALVAMREQFQLIEDRLADGAWWYGDAWSVMDAYLAWAFGRAEETGLPVADYPRFVDHNRRMAQRDSFRQTLAIEAAGTATLEAEGLFRAPPLPV